MMGYMPYGYEDLNRLVTIHTAFLDRGDSAGGIGSNATGDVTLGDVVKGSLYMCRSRMGSTGVW